MLLVENHIIKRNNKNWKTIDSLCFLSKNLYNSCLYKIKQNYIETGKILWYQDLEKSFRNESNTDYFTSTLPTSSSQQILILVDKTMKSYFRLLKSWKKDKKSLNGCPKFPKYKSKDGRFMMIFRGDVLKIKNGFVSFPKKANISAIKTNLTEIKQCRIVPHSGCYKIEFIYEVMEKEIKETGNKCAIDLGLNNLITLVGDNSVPLIINGKPIKSINQYYNKKKSKIQSELKKNHNKEWSNKLNRITLKRDNKIKDYLHKSSRIIVNYLIKNNVNELVIGYNKEWKQDINIGRKNNQNFVQIPFYKLLTMIKYKCKLEGIKFLGREESYTSKCSSLDLEKIDKHDKYMGNRIKRGLFKTSKGLLINADINGSLNIGRKEFGDVFLPADIGLVLNPIKVKPL